LRRGVRARRPGDGRGGAARRAGGDHPMVTAPLLWLAILLGALGLVALGIAFAIPARSRGRTPVAFLTRLTALPAYVRARRRMLWGSLAGLAVIGLTAAF